MNYSYKSFYFKKNKKRNDAKTFLSSLNKQTRLKLEKEMQLLAIFGIEPKKVAIKKFQNDIWKIRVKNCSNNVRLFFYVVNNCIYYLYGFIKSTQKTPEGKKVTINNLKIDLLNALNQSDYEEYLEEIIFNENLE